MRKLLGMMKMFYILMVVVVMCAYKFVKTHQTEHLKCVHFVVCKLYFNKIEERNQVSGAEIHTCNYYIVSPEIVAGEQWGGR